MKNTILIAMLAATLSTGTAWSAPAKPAPSAAATHARDAQVISDTITALESTKKKLESTGSAKTSQHTQNAINDIKKALVELRTGTNPKGH